MFEYYVELGATSRAALAALDVLSCRGRSSRLKKKVFVFIAVYFCAPSSIRDAALQKLF